MARNTKDSFISEREPDAQITQSVRNSLFYAGLAYLTFVIYGSLVPLDFHHRSWDNAWQAFLAIPYLNLGIGSRADWVANILLFIPLAFIWLGILWHRSNFGLKALSTFTILFCAVSLSIGIEFTQLFFPPRTVSLNDIIAESIGACIGIFLWWIYGEKLLKWLTRWSLAKGNTGLAERLLLLYLFGLFGYNLLPLDLTLSPIEIYHKWKEGRVILIPFSFIFENPQQALYGVISDVAIWAPVAFLWRLSSTRPAFSIWLYVISASAFLEFLQLFVYTRVSNVTQILTAALGAAVGLQLANLLKNEKPGIATTASNKGNGALRLILWLAATLCWMSVIVTVFWYPFDFHFSRELAAQNLPGMLKVPFVAYYYGTEYRAATEVLHKIGFFLPLGILLGLALQQGLPQYVRKLYQMFTMLFIPFVALGIEAGQAFLPGKNADITDWILETLGGLAGIFLITKMKQGKSSPASHQYDHKSSAYPFKQYFNVVISLVILTGAFWLITHLPQAPYNVRKLLVPDHPLVSLMLLSSFVYWTIGFPAWYVSYQSRFKTMWPFAAVLLFHAGVAWVLLRFAVPIMMIEKIAASPILGWPWEWELMGRFFGLFGVISLGLTSGAMLANTLSGVRSRTPISYWWINALLLLPLLYWVVVANAATDNIIELMANGGGITASFLLLFSLVILATTGSSVAFLFSGNFSRASMLVAVVFLLSFPLAYFAISLGTEHYIIKYGKVFSALQFLLSSDREHYAGTAELFTRYFVVHIAFIGMVAFVQHPFLGHFDQIKHKSLRKKPSNFMPDSV